MQYTLEALSQLLNCKYHGELGTVIEGVATLETATSSQLTFLENLKYRQKLATTQAGVVILRAPFLRECPVNALVVENPYLAYAKVAELFMEQKRPQVGIHASAVVGEQCQIDASATIGAQVCIGDHVVIGADVIIGPGCVIGDHCEIGNGTRLFANVTLYERVFMGDRCRIHSGVVIGADGFGLASDQGRWHRVPQLGRVMLGNDVDVGANTAIDRGAIEDTVISDGVKLDNLIQIGHNVRIGAHTAIAGCAAVAGSAVIGKHCLIGGGAAINGHITIGDQVCISGMTGVRNSIAEPGIYSSALSALPDKKWRKNHARLNQLDELVRKVNRLEKKVADEK
jgi:UDP-3-O-[3-hydroxymyristoyl] glucosamine N-acyltransferase